MNLKKVLNKLWKHYRSIWFGMFLLLVIMCVCIYGTVFYAANSSLGANAIPLAKAKIFYAWWFAALLAFFFVQFTISTWRVTTMSFGIWTKKTFKRSVDSLKISKSYREWQDIGNVDEIEQKLRKKFTFVHRDGNVFFAHRGLMSRMGPTIIHTGIVIILLAGMVQITLSQMGSSLVVDEGRFAAMEGETRADFFTPKDQSRIIDETNLKQHPIKSTIKVHDFDEIKFANAEVPEYYSTLLEITDGETGKIRFVRVDMNHSVSIDGYQFHQASFVALPPIQEHRFNYDIRRGDTGERVAIVDLEPGTKSMIGESDLMIEIDGERPGDAWRIFKSSNPLQPVETGVLSPQSLARDLSLKPTKILPDFDLRKENPDSPPVPYSKSNEPRNPALFVDVLENGVKVAQTVLFMDNELNNIVSEQNGTLRYELVDIEAVKQENGIDFEAFDWSDPELSQFVINVVNKETEEVLKRAVVSIGETSESITLEPTGETIFPNHARYVIFPVGQTLKYVTVLSVVKDPITHYYTFGVGLIFIGAMLTFTIRYLALHGIWIPESRTFAVELKPRFGAASVEDIAWLEKILKAPSDKSGTGIAVPKPST